MSDKKAKTFLITFFIFISIVFLMMGLLIYINDPLQIWHKSYKNSETMSYTIRESAKAFIRNYDFDSIIMGNSHTENTSSKMADKALGGKFFNLSISGSNIYEKYLILSYALKKKHIKQVVYVLDTHYYRVFETGAKSFDFLYNENPFDDIKVYMNDKYFGCAVGLSPINKCVTRIKDIDRPYMWENKKNHNMRFGGFEFWLNNKDNKQIRADFKKLLETPLDINKEKLDTRYVSDLNAYFNKYLYSIIEKNPNIKFYVIISPVSKLALARMLRNKNLTYQKYMSSLSLLVKASEKYENLEVYAFDDIDAIGKIEDFKDLTHYRSWINEYIIDSIASKEHLITNDNIKGYTDEVFNKAINVDYEYYIDAINKAVNTPPSDK